MGSRKMGFLDNVYGYRPRCVLVVSTGGGGDIATGLLYSEIVAREGPRTVIAALPWERYVKDPCPGPIELELLSGERLSEDSLRLMHGCTIVRCARLFSPTVCKAAEISRSRTTIYAVNGWGGELSVRKGLEEIASLHGCEAMLLVDVGGDVLARGCEQGLWSPLGDSLGLSAATSLGLDAKLVVQGLGADGELSEEELLSIIAELASRDALLWCRGLTRNEASMLEEITSYIHTEAGRIPLLGFRGVYGSIKIRGGTREVRVNVYKSCAAIIEADAVYNTSAPARLVRGTPSLEEARRRLNDAGIYTELDLELDLHKLIELGELTPSKVLEVRARGRSALPSCRQSG